VNEHDTSRRAKNRQTLLLLKQVVALGLSERFRLVDVFPTALAQFSIALDNCIERELIEQVNEGCGKWFYRLTREGHQVASTGKLVSLQKTRLPRDKGDDEPVVIGQEVECASRNGVRRPNTIWTRSNRG
jgi:hypothetical protein